MVEGLKNWIINICSVVIFITAAEMLLPNNNMKKYARFAFGLILISVLISPFLKIFDAKYDINTYAQKAVSLFDDKAYSKNFDSYKEKSEKNTLDAFKSNLEKLCQQDLKQKFPEYNFNIKAEVLYNDDKSNISIKSLQVDVSTGTVEHIRKVDINMNDDNNNINSTSEKSEEIKEYLNTELKIPLEVISVTDGR